MAQRVYLETTILSYLAARASRDIVTAARQQLTRDWWDKRRREFDLFVSDFVIQEIQAGDPLAGQERMALISGLPTLGGTPGALNLAARLIRRDALPARAAQDAIHLAVASWHGADFLLTWNCRHLANAQILRRDS